MYENCRVAFLLPTTVRTQVAPKFRKVVSFSTVLRTGNSSTGTGSCFRNSHQFHHVRTTNAIWQLVQRVCNTNMMLPAIALQQQQPFWGVNENHKMLRRHQQWTVSCCTIIPILLVHRIAVIVEAFQIFSNTIPTVITPSLLRNPEYHNDNYHPRSRPRKYRA